MNRVIDRIAECLSSGKNVLLVTSAPHGHQISGMLSKHPDLDLDFRKMRRGMVVTTAGARLIIETDIRALPRKGYDAIFFDADMGHNAAFNNIAYDAVRRLARITKCQEVEGFIL